MPSLYRHTIYCASRLVFPLFGQAPSSLSDSGLRLIAESDFWRFEGLPDVGGLSSKGFRGRISAFSGRQSVERRRATALSGRDEGEHPLDVPDHGVFRRAKLTL